MSHEIVEKNVGLMALLILLVISVGGLVQIVPLFFLTSTTEPVQGLSPYSALELEGRDVYVREGCYVCHSQMIRPFRAETERYGHYSVAGEFVYDRPFQWGSKRTGPDLARVGKRYSDDWHRVHLRNPRDVVPESNMPGYPWMQDKPVDWSLTEKKLRLFKDVFGVPYSDEDIAEQMKKVEGEWANASEEDAVVAYLQQLGLDRARR